MATGKTTTLTFRIEPGLKEALRIAAAREHRSLANMVEVLIRDYCVSITTQNFPGINTEYFPGKSLPQGF